MSNPARMATARRALACLDLTYLEEDCTSADIDRLCARAVTRHGPVAAVCIWPRFVAQAKRTLGDTPMKIATVVNFPAGTAPVEDIVAECRQAIADGADEIDMVIPWRSMADHPEIVDDQIGKVRVATRGTTLKTILETGELKDETLIAMATGIAIRAGADFVKTSTGKVAVNATPEAARTMLTLIADYHGRTGFKAAGGIRTLDDAAVYLGLADEILGPGWATPATFRFGASSLLDALTAEIEGETARPGTGY